MIKCAVCNDRKCPAGVSVQRVTVPVTRQNKSRMGTNDRNLLLFISLIKCYLIWFIRKMHVQKFLKRCAKKPTKRIWLKFSWIGDTVLFNGDMHAEMMHKYSEIFRVSPTFQESVSCNGEEGKLEEGLAENEGLEPLWRVHHHRVFELLGVPPENILQLHKDQRSKRQRVKVQGKGLFCC